MRDMHIHGVAMPAVALPDETQLNSGERGIHALIPPLQRMREHRGRAPTVVADDWRKDVRAVVRAHLADFVASQCLSELGNAKVDVAGEVLSGFVDGGKYVRSTFMYLGWLCGAPEDEAALRAAASLELFHAFALMQDDVMDESALPLGMRAMLAVALDYLQGGATGKPAG